MSEDEEDVPLLGENDELSLNFDSSASPVLERTGVSRGKKLYQLKANYEALDYEVIQSSVRQLEMKKSHVKSTRYDLKKIY